MAAVRPRPGWRTWLALGLAAVVAVALGVLLVRSPHDQPAASAPVATTSPTPEAAGTSPAAVAPRSAPATAGPRTPTAAPSRPAPGTTASTTSGTPSPSPRRSTAPADPAPASTRPAAPLDEPEAVDAGLTARVRTLEAVQGEALGPGEVAGPALRATLVLTNRTGHAVDLSSSIVSLFYGPDQTPASPVSGPGARALPARLARGGSATGRFVFTVPADQRDDVLITLDYSVDTPVVAFRGRAPR